MPCDASCLRSQILQKSSGQQPSLLIYPRSLQEVTSGGNAPSGDELFVMTYRVFGFVLRSRKWAQLDLRLLSYENKQNNDRVKNAFDRLVLPAGHKDMVQALVTQHFRDKKSSFIQT